MRTILISFILFAVAYGGGWWLSSRRMASVLKEAAQQAEIARQWQRKYEQAYPLAYQWRVGYENLKKRCGE